MGGKGIAELSNTSGIYYTRLIADVSNGKSLSNASGKTYHVPVIVFLQGESDTYSDMSKSDYYNSMVSLFTNLNTDIKAITGQLNDIQFFVYQVACFDFYTPSKFTYPDVSLAQLQIANDLDNVHLVSPIYHLPKIGDNVHFSAVGSRWFGGYAGIAYKRTVIDKLPYSCLTIDSYTIVGNDIYVKFKGVKESLTFDTTSVIDRGVSKGFQIRNIGDRAQNSFLNIITNVQINKWNVVKITCSSSPIGKKLTYAINGTGSSDISSGNLRDKQNIIYNFPNVLGSSDVAHKMYNWCSLFETIL